MVMLLNKEGALMTQDMEKSEVLNAFFTPVSTSKNSLQKYKDSDTRLFCTRGRKTCVREGGGLGRERERTGFFLDLNKKESGTKEMKNS